MNDELPSTVESWALADDCSGCGASAGGCALKKRFSGRLCCAWCAHRRITDDDLLEAS